MGNTAKALRGSIIHEWAKKLYPNNEDLQDAWIEGYVSCDKKWHRGPKDWNGGTEDFSKELINQTNAWFRDNCPMWGVVLEHNLWQYALAKYFYELGKTLI